MIAITEMVRQQMKAVPLNAIVNQPTLNSVQHLVEQLTAFASHFTTTKWGGKHEFLLLVLSEAKMRQAARNNNLDCERPRNLSPSTQESSTAPRGAISSNYNRTRRPSGRSTPSKRWSTQWLLKPLSQPSTRNTSRNSRSTA